MKRLILMFLLFHGAASSGNLYRCVSHAGHVSYQSATCGAGQRTDRVIGFAPEPVVAAAATMETKHRPTKRANRRGSYHVGVVTASSARPSPCAKAKASRDTRLRKLGLRRTFDDLRRIDEVVRGACGG